MPENNGRGLLRRMRARVWCPCIDLAIVCAIGTALALPAWGAAPEAVTGQVAEAAEREPLTPEAAAEVILSVDGAPVILGLQITPPDRFDEAREVVKSAMGPAASPRVNLAAASALGVWGDELDLAARAAKIAVEAKPDLADAVFVQGAIQFSLAGRDGASMMQRQRFASEGRDAFERAIELEPEHPGARLWLAMYHTYVPWIAGGRKGKAKEMASSLERDPEHAWLGGQLALTMALNDEKWKEAASAYEVIEQANGPNGSVEAARLQYALALLLNKEDAETAIPLLRAHEQSAPDAGGVTIDYAWGIAFQLREEWSKAAGRYERVMKANPDARSTPYRLAAVYDKMDRKADALRWYEHFVLSFPDDSRAKDAKKRIKKLKR